MTPATPVSPLLARRRLTGLAGGVLLVLLLATVYWVHLLGEQAARLQEAETQTRQRAVQVSTHIAAQVGTLVSGLEYLAQSLASTYAQDPLDAFPLAVRTALQTFAGGSIAQVAVADASGRVSYSSLAGGQGTDLRAVSIADREHFRVHAQGGPPRLFISRPVLGRVSGQWSIQLSYPLRQDGRFAGVVVVSVAPDYLARNLRELFGTSGDVALLLRADGDYLAISHDQYPVMGKKVLPDRPFLADPQTGQGEYITTNPIDGVERYYAWNRLAAYPLVLVVGLDRAQALAPTHRANLDSRWRNGLGSAVIVLALLWIAYLFTRMQNDRALLQDNRQRYQLALEGGALGVWDWSLSTHRFSVDPRLSDLLGRAPAELQQSLDGPQTLVHPDDWPGMQAVREQVRGGRIDSFERALRMRHRDGHWRWVEVRGKVSQREPDGRATRAFGTFADITARREAEAVRAELQARLGKLVAQVPGMVYQYRLAADGRSSFPYASPGIAEIYGLTPEQAQQDASPVFGRIHPDDRQRVADGIAASARDLTPWECEYRTAQADGAVRWVAGLAQPEREADGATLWHGYIRDITEKHAAHEALRRSEERLRLTAAAVRDGLWEWDTASGRMELDARCQDILGHPGESRHVGFDDWCAAMHPGDRQRVLSTLQRQVELGEPFGIELRLRGARGGWCWVEIRGQVAPLQSSEGAWVIGTLTDITERKREQEALATARAHLLAVIEHVPGGVLVQNTAGAVVVANDEACQLLALRTPADALVGLDAQGLQSLMPPEILNHWQLAQHGNTVCDLHSGRTLKFEQIGMRSAGQDLGCLWIVRDITERRRHEQTLQHLASTDALTGLANRRVFMERLQAELEQLAQGGPPGVVIMLDLDHFKRVNDTYGHAAGDRVLVHLAQILRGQDLRQNDLAGRLGGEEFAVLLPATTPDEAAAVAERLRVALEASRIDSGEGRTITLTLSAGLAPLSGDAEHSLALADAALYQAKNSGRNRIVTANPAAPDGT